MNLTHKRKEQRWLEALHKTDWEMFESQLDQLYTTVCASDQDIDFMVALLDWCHWLLCIATSKEYIATSEGE